MAPRQFSKGPWRVDRTPGGALGVWSHGVHTDSPDVCCVAAVPTKRDIANANLIGAATEMHSALAVIFTAVRGDEKSQCWDIRRWLDERGIFNGDLGATERLIEEVCKHVIQKAKGGA